MRLIAWAEPHFYRHKVVTSRVTVVLCAYLAFGGDFWGLSARGMAISFRQDEHGGCFNVEKT